jgi:hypothetical protein
VALYAVKLCSENLNCPIFPTLAVCEQSGRSHVTAKVPDSSTGIVVSIPASKTHLNQVSVHIFGVTESLIWLILWLFNFFFKFEYRRVVVRPSLIFIRSSVTAENRTYDVHMTFQTRNCLSNKILTDIKQPDATSFVFPIFTTNVTLYNLPLAHRLV